MAYRCERQQVFRGHEVTGRACPVTRAAKAKFKVGQVVCIKASKDYVRVGLITEAGIRDVTGLAWSNYELRSLTKRERGGE